MKPRDDEDLPLSRQRRVDDDVRGELEFHLDQRVRDLLAQGHAPDDARRMAQQAFGDRDTVEAECREIESRRRATSRRVRRMTDLRDDFRLGVRLLRKSPAFTLSAVATLALGIGANTAVFSIVDDVILTPLAYEEADRLVEIVERHERGHGDLPWSTFRELAETASSFSAMAEYGSGPSTILGTDRALRLEAAWISRDFFRVFPLRPVLGRLPLPEEHQPGAPPVAVVSYAFWRDRLGSPPSLEGQRLRLSFDHAVIGVLPAAFEFPNGSQVWTPIELDAPSESHTAHNWTAIGRLRPGVAPIAAQREVDALLARMREQYYPDFDAVGSTITPLQDVLTASARTPLYLLLGASGVLLLAACTNLASAGLARGSVRAGEFAVRSALGAARKRLVRQLLTESAVLCVLGTVAGLLLAVALLRAVVPLAPAGLQLERITIDARVLAFATLVAVITTMLTGLLPALRISQSSTGAVLRAGVRGTADVHGSRAWRVLVASEVALAIVLLAGSGLLIRSFVAVLATDLGFEPAGVLRTDVELPAVNYDGSSPAVPTFHERVLAATLAAPGVESAGFVNRLPLTGGNPSGGMEVEGKPHDPRGPFTGYAVYRVIGGAYFETIGIPLLAGRPFGPGDDRAGPPVVIVSGTLARTQWPGENAVGKRLRPVGMDGGEEPWHTVIGVVGDTRSVSVTDAFREVYYFDHRQRPPSRAYSTTYVSRSTGNAMADAPVIRQVIESVDPQVPIEQRPLETLVSQSVADRRFLLVVIGTFSAVALLLAVVGIHAVVSYTVAQRTREIGVRLALGATPTQVRAHVMLDAMKSVVPGLVVGGMLAIGATSVMRTLVYGVSPLDPVALGAAVLLLAAAGVASSLAPAIRATRVDPLLAIRNE
jgi:predicted permease